DPPRRRGGRREEMIRRVLPLLFAGLFALAGAIAAQAPADKDEPPLRLKKKRPAAEKPAPVKPDPDDPDKPAEEKKEPAGKKKEPAKEKEEAGKEAPEPGEPEVDEKEVLQRVTRNMRSVEDRLAKREIDEGTRQLQEDILKDLDSLIRRSQSPQSGQGG